MIDQKKNINLKNLILFIFCLLLIFLTNNKLGFNDSILAFSDQKYYLKLFNSAPDFPSEKFGAQHAQRFAFIYLIGTVLKFLNVSFLWEKIFIIFNLLNFLLIIFLLKKNFHILHEKDFSNLWFIFLLALIFNPYFLRASIYAPLMINDYIFITGILMLILGFENNNKKLLVLAIIICSFSRQTALIIVPAILIMSIYDISIKKRNPEIFNFILILIVIVIFQLTYKISSNHRLDTNISNFIFGIFNSEFTIKDIINSLSRILLANFVIILLLVKFFKKILTLKFFSNKLVLLSLLISFGIWSQPILAGPYHSVGNEARLTIMALPIFLLALSYFFEEDIELNKKDKFILILLFTLSSLHHKYSFLAYFNLENYWQVIFTLPIIIYLFYIFFLRKISL